MSIFDAIADFFADHSDPMKLSSFVPERTTMKPMATNTGIQGQIICSEGQRGEKVAEFRPNSMTGGLTAIIRGDVVQYGTALPMEGMEPSAPLDFQGQQNFRTEIKAQISANGRRRALYRKLLPSSDTTEEVNTPRANKAAEQARRLTSVCGYKINGLSPQ